MIENLTQMDQGVTWYFQEKEVQIEMHDIIMASVLHDQSMVRITSGHEFVEDEVFFYSFKGKPILSYHLKEEKVCWRSRFKNMSRTIPNLNQAMYVRQTGHIYILFHHQTVKILKRNGKTICECNAPIDHVYQYIARINSKPVVVCDVKEADEHGSYRRSFYINEKSGELEEIGLKYV